MTTDTIALNVRLPRQLHERLTGRAAELGPRTMNTLIVQAVEAQLDADEARRRADAEKIYTCSRCGQPTSVLEWPSPRDPAMCLRCSSAVQVEIDKREREAKEARRQRRTKAVRAHSAM